jgi:hypothetical protein
VSEPLELGRFEPDAVVEFSDVAVDPHFDSNRFLYLATVVTAPGRERRMDVFRAREIAERVGEAAMIVSLPASPAGYPAMSAGPDERLYVAMPAEAGAATGRHPSDGRLLRFTRDGASAGHERSGSPILGIGSSKPTSLAWNSEARLLVASDDRVEHRLAAVALSQFSRSSVWPVTAFPVVNADAAFQGGLRALAVGRRSAGQTGDETLFIVGTDPQALYLATLASETQVELTSLRPVPLGPFSPAAAAVAAGGDLFIAGTLGDAASETGVLHLRYR